MQTELTNPQFDFSVGAPNANDTLILTTGIYLRIERSIHRVENAHLTFRRRERATLRFMQVRSLQKFVAVHSSVHYHFNHLRNIERRTRFKDLRAAALLEWRDLLAG